MLLLGGVCVGYCYCDTLGWHGIGFGSFIDTPLVEASVFLHLPPLAEGVLGVHYIIVNSLI